MLPLFINNLLDTIMHVFIEKEVFMSCVLRDFQKIGEGLNIHISACQYRVHYKMVTE